MRKILGEMWSNGVFRATAALIMGGTAAKAISLLSMPVLARLYSPEAFGLLAFFTSATTVVGSVLTLRYVVALPIPKSDRRAAALLLLNCLLILSLSTLFAVAMFGASKITAPGTNPVGNLDFWRRYWWLIPLGAAAFALYETVSMWATREKRYGLLSRSQVAQTLSGTAVKLVGGFVSPGPLALVAGQIVQQSGGILGMMRSAISSFLRAVKGYRPRHIRYVAFRYTEFPVYKLPSHFIYSLSAQAPVLFSTYMWGASVTGQLGVAFQAISLPVTLVSQNAGRVYYAELASIGRSNPRRAAELTKYLAARLLIVGIVAGTFIYAFAPLVFDAVFGREWSLAGDIARAMAVAVPAQFVASPLIMAYNIYGNQRQVLVIHSTRAVIVFSVFPLCHYMGLDAVSTIYFYSAAISLHYFSVCYRISKIMRGNS